MAANFPAMRHRTESLAQASLEIGRVLAQRDGMTFRADGTCMYPAVRPGDILRIRPCDIGDAEVGDIAVCRRPAHLFCHRVIAKGRDGERDYIITRPDRLPDGDDGPTHYEDFLGIVSDIKRSGRSIPADEWKTAAYAWHLRTWFALRIKMMENAMRAQLWWYEAIFRIQESAFYRLLASTWMAAVSPRMSYRVRVPQPALGDSVYRELKPEEFDPQADWRGRPVNRWTLVLHINSAREPAAWMTWSRGKNSSWAEVESFVLGRYRGTGLEKKLRSEAEPLLRPSTAADDSSNVTAPRERTERIADGATRYA